MLVNDNVILFTRRCQRFYFNFFALTIIAFDVCRVLHLLSLVEWQPTLWILFSTNVHTECLRPLVQLRHPMQYIMLHPGQFCRLPSSTSGCSNRYTCLKTKIGNRWGCWWEVCFISPFHKCQSIVYFCKCVKGDLIRIRELWQLFHTLV